MQIFNTTNSAFVQVVLILKKFMFEYLLRVYLVPGLLKLLYFLIPLLAKWEDADQLLTKHLANPNDRIAGFEKQRPEAKFRPGTDCKSAPLGLTGNAIAFVTPPVLPFIILQLALRFCVTVFTNTF